MTLNEEISRELTTFRGTTFSDSVSATNWIAAAMRRIAEKTLSTVLDFAEAPQTPASTVAVRIWKRKDSWLRTDTPEKGTPHDVDDQGFDQTEPRTAFHPFKLDEGSAHLPEPFCKVCRQDAHHQNHIQSYAAR